MAKTSSRRVPPRSGGALTVSLPEFLVDGSDLQFREFVADLFAAVAGMQALRRALASCLGLTSAEYSVLLATWHLQKRGRVGISSIANHLHLAATNVTPDVNSLVRTGLIRKRPHPKDTRAVDLAVTAKGEALLNRLAPLLRRINDRLFAGHTPDAIAAVAQFTKQLADESGHAIAVARSGLRD